MQFQLPSACADRTKRWTYLSLFTLALALGFGLSSASAQRPSPNAPRTSFSRDVVPILRTACVGCHADTNPAGGISLNSYMALMKGGKRGPAVTPGKGAESRIVKMMIGTLQPKMPPSGGGLKSVDIDKIRAWIDAGAKPDTVVEAPAGKSPGIGRAPNPAAPVRPTGKSIAAAAPVASMAFSPDGKVLAVGTYREVQLWNAETRSLNGVWTGHADAVRSIVYSKDGKWLIAGGGPSGLTGEVRIWDVANSKETHTFVADHADAVSSVSLNPDGTRLVTGSADKLLKVWELATGKCLNTLRDHSDAVWAVAWSPDGKYLASASSDRSIKVWDAESGRRRYSIRAHDDIVDHLEFSADGSRIISSSADKTAKVWGFGPDGSGNQRTLGGHGGPVLFASFGADPSSVVTCSGDKTVKVWSDSNNTRTFTDPKDWVYVARISPDKKRIAAGTWDGQILIWAAADGKLEGTVSTLKP